MTGESKKQGEMGRLQGELSRLWQNRYVIFLSAMTCFAMLGNFSDGDNRVVHALNAMGDTTQAMRLPEEMPFAKVEFEQDTFKEQVLKNVTEKNLELIRAGFDPSSSLFKNSVMAEALKKSGIGFTYENLDEITKFLGERSANVLVEESVGGFPKLQCLELVSWLGRIGAIDPRLVMPGRNVREVTDLLDTFRGQSGKLTEFNGYDDRKVIVAKDVMDPRLWKSEVSILYGLKSKYDTIGHTMVVVKMPNSDEYAVIQSNATMKDGNIWEIGSGEDVTLTIFPTIDEFEALTRQLRLLYVLPYEQ